MSSSDNGVTLERRQLLKRIGATGAVGALAGCSGNNDGGGTDGGGTDGGDTDGAGTDDGGSSDGGNELGERVPPLVIEFWSGHPVWDNTVPLVKEHISSALNHEVQVKPVEVAKMVSDAYNDKRNYHYVTWGLTPSVTTLDPGAYWLTDLVITSAGANNKPSAMNYASCEFTDLAYEQTVAGDLEKRQELLAESMVVFSEDRPAVNLIARDIFGGARTDAVDVNGVGDMGSQAWNATFFTQTTPKSGDRWVYGSDDTGYWERTNHLMISAGAIGIYQVLAHSPLLKYDENWELTQELATDYTVENSSRKFTFEIHEDAVFHNGDPITAEDVKFTMETIENNPLPQRVKQNYKSITTVDEKTVEFTFEEPNPSFTTAHIPTWGILHKPTWEGMEDPSSFNPEPPIVGSGPMQVTSFQKGQSVVWGPHPEGHPNYDVSHGFVHQRFQNAETKKRALREGEIHVAGNMTGAGLEQVKNELGDSLERLTSRGHGAWHLAASYARAPVKFDAWQDAVGKAINRDAINQAVYAGNGNPVTTSAPYVDNNPFYPEDKSRVHNYTDNLQGEPEAARQTLRDAGWGWDDDGNLRYPKGADTSPLWPKGEVPSADQFQCLTDDGTFDQDWEP
jgi:peptide/nickel transport system substrate-binding protein